ncbi:3-oxoadipyl-CoA thiolase [Roseobacteraceae bacterium S113]
MDAFICEGIRTAIGRYGGGLAQVRADDLAALPVAEIVTRAGLQPDTVDEVILGCANQAGEDNRNVARMAALLAGLPESVPALTVNRLCASGLDAIALAARGIKAGELDVVIAGGVESMSRAPLVMPKPDVAFSRRAEVYDTTIGWRFINRAMAQAYGTESMPETADNVAEEFGIARADQDAFAHRSQKRCAAAQAAGIFAEEILPVAIPQRRSDPLLVSQDEHPRLSTLDKLAGLRPINGAEKSVTAGNASGVNDGAAAVLLASDAAVNAQDLTPQARVVCAASVGVAPRIMGIGPVDAVKKALRMAGLTLEQMDVIELNEAFAAQALAVTRALGLADDDARVNPNGGAIALGHPLGMSGTRIALTAARHLQRTGGQYAMVTMCVGVGQGVAMILERV